MKKGLFVFGICLMALVGNKVTAQEDNVVNDAPSHDIEEVIASEMNEQEMLDDALNLIDREMKEERREKIREEHRGMKGHHGQKGDKAECGAHKRPNLDLSDEQKEQMKALRMEGQKQSKPYKDQLRELKAKQQTLTTAASPDQKAINANIKEMGELMTELAIIKAENHQKVRALLTEEQRMQFDTMAAHRGHGGKRGGKHGRS